MCIDERRFEAARNKIMGADRVRQGIGTLSEKTIHAVLKNYYAPDADMHEIPLEGFVADIFTGTVLEISKYGNTYIDVKSADFLSGFDNGDIELLWQDWESDPESLTYWTDFDFMAEKKVIAWRPLPEPYRSANKTEASDWRKDMLRKFDRRD